MGTCLTPSTKNKIMQVPKKELIIKDPKAIKALNKPIAQKILKSFYKRPLTAPEIAEKIEFPKDKIHYHIKKLISLDILIITGSEMIMGIKQKKFFPSAFQIIFNNQNILNLSIRESPKTSLQEINDQKKGNAKKQIHNKERKKGFKSIINKENEKKHPTKKTYNQKNHDEKFNRFLIERRRNDDRRYLNDKRLKSERRNYQVVDYGSENKRKTSKRRSEIERRIYKKRRLKNERRGYKSYEDKIEPETIKGDPSKTYQIKSRFFNNTLLHFNGITNAMTFVHTGDIVTFMQARLGYKGFTIIRLQKYKLPFNKNNQNVKNLPELIDNVYHQFIKINQRQKLYLAIHSDGYHYEMTYMNVKNKVKDFRPFLDQVMDRSYGLSNNRVYSAFNYNNNNENGAVICYSKNKELITRDYDILVNTGIQPRYNTSLPVILHNLYQYYKTISDSDHVLIIYIGYYKTQIIVLQNDQLVDSCDFSIGLEHFVDQVFGIETDGAEFDGDKKQKIRDFLELYGFANEDDLPSQLEFISWSEAQDAIYKVWKELKKSIIKSNKRLSNIRENRDHKLLTIDEIFIGGPGSHIKNIDDRISRTLNKKVKKLDSLNTASMEKSKDSKKNILSQFKEKSILKKQTKSKNYIEELKIKITGHKKAIETANSKESIRYRLARYEIEKNSKQKKIKDNTKKLIANASDFKLIKDEYEATQETLTNDLKLIMNNLEEISGALMHMYKEKDYLVKHISKTEFETDRFQKHRKEADLKLKGDYSTKLKDSASKRIELSEKKELYEREVIELQEDVLEKQERLHTLNQQLDNGHDDLAVLEYLFDTVTNLSNSISKTLLLRLKDVDDLKKIDRKKLEKAGYLMIINKQRLSGIKKNFSKMIDTSSYQDKEKYIDGENGYEIRKKLITILDRVLQMPINLENLKSSTSRLIATNGEREELIKRRDFLKEKLESKKKSHLKLSNELIDLEKESKALANQEEELAEGRKMIMHSIDRVDSLINILNEKNTLDEERESFKNKIFKNEEKLIDVQSKIKNLRSEIKTLKVKMAEITKIGRGKIGKLLIDKKNFQKNEEILKNDLSARGEEAKEIHLKLIDLTQLHEKLIEQTRIRKKQKSDFLKSEKQMLKEIEKKKKKLNQSLSKELKKYEKEKSQIISISDKKANLNKNSLKKELIDLKKKKDSVKNLWENFKVSADGSRKLNKLIIERDRLKRALSDMKKKKNPLIRDLKRQINFISKELERTEEFQKQFDDLEEQKIDQDDLIADEKKVLESEIETIRSRIQYKNSEGYLLIMQEGLSRFQNTPDALESARSMAKESIKIDQDEINAIEKVLSSDNKKYNSFIIKYKKQKTELVRLLKPLKSRETFNRKKEVSLKKNLQKAESSVKTLQIKFDNADDCFKEKKSDYQTFEESVKSKLKDINGSIAQIKKENEKESLLISDDLKEKLNALEERLHQEKGQTNIQIEKLNLKANKEILEQKIKLEEQLKTDEIQTSAVKKEIEILKNDQSQIHKEIIVLRKALGKIKIELPQINSKTQQLEELTDKNDLELNRELEEYSDQLAEKLKDEKELQEDNTIFHSQINQLTKEIKEKEQESVEIENILFQMNQDEKSPLRRLSLSKQKQKDSIRKFLKSDELNSLSLKQLLTKNEKDLKRIASQKSQLDEKERTSENVLKDFSEEIKKAEKDLLETANLINNNKRIHADISLSQIELLNIFEEYKTLYPSIKIMLEDRIQILYALVDQKNRERQESEIQLPDWEAELKKKKSDIAIIERDLNKINEDMKQVLEYSLYEQENDSEEFEIELSESKYKLESYIDLAEMKARSESLFQEIINAEEEVASLQKQQSSIKHVMNESDKISQKKIKRMEEICGTLENDINKDKAELEKLEKTISELKDHTKNFGERIETLEEDLHHFREEQSQQEMLLKDYDRSLTEIYKTMGDKGKSYKRKAWTNSIDLDYMANLGLLMAPKEKFNLLSKEHKNDFWYFPVNKFLQNSLVVMIFLFSLTAFSQRMKLEPLKQVLPKKNDEIMLLELSKNYLYSLKERDDHTNFYQKFISDNKTLSENTIFSIKYLSNKIPKNFKITNMDVERNIEKQSLVYTPAKGDIEFGKTNHLIVSISGFVNKGIQQAEKDLKIFQEKLTDDKIFKSIEVSTIKNENKWKSSFKINLLL